MSVIVNQSNLQAPSANSGLSFIIPVRAGHLARLKGIGFTFVQSDAVNAAKILIQFAQAGKNNTQIGFCTVPASAGLTISGAAFVGAGSREAAATAAEGIVGFLPDMWWGEDVTVTLGAVTTTAFQFGVASSFVEYVRRPESQ